MARGNGKPDPTELDTEHELPPGDDDAREDGVSAGAQPQVLRGAEFDKLKAERDTLVDRLARLQAEFENARKRAAREQQDFREYALADAVKELLPTLDSFERALQTSAGDRSEFRGGVELIYKQLQDALVKLGLRPLRPRVNPLIPIFTRPLKW